MVGIVIQILFDPLSGLLSLGEGLQARIGLPGARRKWEAQGVQHYTFDIQGYVPLVCTFGGNVEVEDGIVVHTGPRSDAGANLNRFLDPGFLALEDYPICNYKNYTMPILFDEIEQWTHESPFSITQISFDSKYGFISSFGFGNCGGQGLLSPRVSDCPGGFTIENFQILDN